MKMDGNTILITGGGSGIGRGLAEAFHHRGNQVIITGRGLSRLKAVCEANPGMLAVELDVRDPAAVKRVAAQMIADHPSLNVLINNAGIMELDDVTGPVDEELLVSTVTTNLGGPIRMSGALVGHLKNQKDAVIINVSSILAFVPLVPTAAYSATKAALHSYTLSQRYKLRDIGIHVIELAPPWVRTNLLNSSEEERAMPLDAFIEDTMAMLATDADEILVGQAPQMRANPGPQEHGWVNQFNDLIAAGPPLG
jgi:uncharacterized oxidoreductase